MKFLLITLFIFSAASATACSQHSKAEAENHAGISGPERIENGLPPVVFGGDTLQYTLTEWMEKLAIPGLSIAVIDNYEIAWSKGYGVKEMGNMNAPVTETTLFQVASISKPVTAIALMDFSGQGLFDLDADVNDYLHSWQLPKSRFGQGQKVTLRHLLSHSAGVTPGGYPGYDKSEEMPGLVQILEGSPPASSQPTRIVAVPGSGFIYSGPGYSMIQLVLEDQFDKPFDEIMEESIIGKLGLQNSTFKQELSDEFAQRAASGHYFLGDPLQGGWFRYPEKAAAGLWTTPSDLAKIMIEVAQSAAGNSNRILSTETVQEMLTIETGVMGLGFMVRPENEFGYFSHSGRNQGFVSEFHMYGDEGKGLVIVTNSDVGGYLSAFILQSVAREYEWPDADQQSVSDGLALNLFFHAENVQRPRTEIEPDPVVLSRYTGRYLLEDGFPIVISLGEDRLNLTPGNQRALGILAESETEFFSREVDVRVTFKINDKGEADALILHQHGRDLRAERVE
jgi:CubicO group peptidase (beta-lactamase class C family)